MKTAALCLVLGLLATGTESAKLPSFITPCSLSDPDMNACLLNTTRNILSTFSRGIPELGVHPLDPVSLKKINVNAPGLQLVFDNVTLSGLGDGRINDFKMNMAKKKARLDFTGNLTMRGHYKIDGRILILPITGEGNCTNLLKNMNLVFYYNFENRTGEDGKQYLFVTITKRSFKLDNAHFHLENLFNGNKLLAEPTMNFLNENWEIVMNDLVGYPVFDQLIKACVKVVNKFQSKVPWEDLFLP